MRATTFPEDVVAAREQTERKTRAIGVQMINSPPVRAEGPAAQADMGRGSGGSPGPDGYRDRDEPSRTELVREAAKGPEGGREVQGPESHEREARRVGHGRNL